MQSFTIATQNKQLRDKLINIDDLYEEKMKMRRKMNKTLKKLEVSNTQMDSRREKESLVV